MYYTNLIHRKNDFYIKYIHIIIMLNIPYSILSLVTL